MVAGPGFGKTTALVQALRSNMATPAGIDIWIALDADDDDRRLASAVVDGLHAQPPEARPTGAPTPLDIVLDAIVRMAPVDVCLLLDDCHKLPSDSSGHRLIGRLVEGLPANGHVVLSSRHPPTIPMARLRASADVVDIGEEELRFSPDEVASLARLHDQGADSPTEVGGWPALVALSLSTHRAFATDYLWEEIVAGLSPGSRQALLAMSTQGEGSFDDAIEVGGVDVADVRTVVRSVPLIRGDPADGVFSVHDLWVKRTADLFPTDEIETTRARVLALMAERGHALRLGSFALEWGDDPALLTAARSLVETTLIQLPVEAAERWLAAAPLHLLDEPELRLLALAVAATRWREEPDVDARADEVIESFLARDDTEGALTAGTMAATAAYRRRDVSRVLALADRLRRTPHDGSFPIARTAAQAWEATVALLEDRIDEALDILATTPLDDLPSTFADVIRMMQVNLFMQSGRPDEALKAASALDDANPVTEQLSFIHWYAGNPADALHQPPSLDDAGPLDTTTSRFTRRSETADIAASLGLTDLAHAARVELLPSVGPAGGAFFSAGAAGAVAKTLVLDHNESAAGAVIETHLNEYSIDEPAGERALRRRLGTVYLLHDELASRWDEAELNELHQRVRGLARLVRDARGPGLEAGNVIDEPDLALTCLPLPWSVELAVAARRDAIPGATDLVDTLTSHALGAVRSELRHLAGSDRDSVASTAADLLAELPDEGGPALRVEVLGPMAIQLAGERTDPPELRRARVRTVLTLLVVRGPDATRRADGVRLAGSGPA